MLCLLGCTVYSKVDLVPFIWGSTMFFVPVGRAAKPILWEFFRLYPSAQDTVNADSAVLAELFQPLGLHRKRAAGIIRFSGTANCWGAHVCVCVIMYCFGLKTVY